MLHNGMIARAITLHPSEVHLPCENCKLRKCAKQSQKKNIPITSSKHNFTRSQSHEALIGVRLPLETTLAHRKRKEKAFSAAIVEILHLPRLFNKHTKSLSQVSELTHLGVKGSIHTICLRVLMRRIVGLISSQ